MQTINIIFQKKKGGEEIGFEYTYFSINRLKVKFEILVKIKIVVKSTKTIEKSQSCFNIMKTNAKIAINFHSGNNIILESSSVTF